MLSKLHKAPRKQVSGGTILLSGHSTGMIQAKHINRYKFIQQIETEKENGLLIKQIKAIVQSPHPGDVGK